MICLRSWKNTTLSVASTTANWSRYSLSSELIVTFFERNTHSSARSSDARCVLPLGTRHTGCTNQPERAIQPERLNRIFVPFFLFRLVSLSKRAWILDDDPATVRSNNVSLLRKISHQENKNKKKGKKEEKKKKKMSDQKQVHSLKKRVCKKRSFVIPSVKTEEANWRPASRYPYFLNRYPLYCIDARRGNFNVVKRCSGAGSGGEK